MDCLSAGTGPSALKDLVARTFHIAITPELRSKLFWTVCIPARLSLYTLLALSITMIPAMRFAVAGGAALTFIRLVGAGDTGQWWSRKFQAFMSLCVAYAALTQKPIILWAVLVASVLSGVILAAGRSFC